MCSYLLWTANSSEIIWTSILHHLLSLSIAFNWFSRFGFVSVHQIKSTSLLVFSCFSCCCCLFFFSFKIQRWNEKIYVYAENESHFISIVVIIVSSSIFHSTLSYLIFIFISFVTIVKRRGRNYIMYRFF